MTSSFATRSQAWRRIGTFAALAITSVAGCATPTATIQPVAVQRTAWRFENREGIELRSPHYLIRTTCKNTPFVDALPGFLESCWAAYEKLLPSDRAPAEPLTTYLFQSRGEWERFTEGFAPARASVYKKIRSGGYSERGVTVSHYSIASATLSILAHEGFHQYLELTRGKSVPAWLNEGLACYFEAFDLDQANRPIFRPDKNSLRRGHLSEAVVNKRLIPLPEILGTHAGEQVQKPSADVRGYYAQEWSLVLFLLQPAKTNPYAAGFQELLRDLGTDALQRRAEAGLSADTSGKVGSGEAVFRAYVTSDLAGFQAAYENFVHQLLGIQS